MIDYKNAAFDKCEYDGRVRRAQEELERCGIDLLLVHEIGNICWLCGVQSLCWNKYFMLAVPRKGSPVLVIQSFEAYNAYLNTWLPGDRILQYYSGESPNERGRPAEDPLEVSVRLVMELGFESKTIGVEESTACPGISAAGFRKLRSGLPRVKFADASGLVERLRAVKSPEELRQIKQAAGISSAAMLAVMEHAETGMTDNDLAAEAHRLLAVLGSEYMCLDPIITIGPRSGVPHTTYARHRICPGDTGLMEFGACVNRYSAPTMRAVSFREPSDSVRYMADGCIASVGAVLEHAKPGAVCHDVAMKAEEAISEHIKRYMWHGIYGYSVGLGFPPRWDDCGDVMIVKGNRSVLMPGMVFHVSTTLRELGRHSITVSETAAITQTGCEAFTSVPRKLFVR